MSTAPPVPRKPAPPRTILVWIIVLTVVALGGYAVAPWVLPVRIVEGPMVQMAGPDQVTLIWYTTRPAACTLVLAPDLTPQRLPVESHGRRNRIVIDKLEPDGTYTYAIHCGERVLTDTLRFQTNQIDDSYTFFVVGDSGKASRAQFDIAAEMLRTRPAPDFILHTGDLVYNSGERRKYAARFFTPYQEFLSRINFWPCVGNHDVDDDGDAAPYRAVFELPDNGPDGCRPELNYWFDYATCRVAVIDSNVDENVLREEVAPWLGRVMSTPGPTWRFVSFHHPPYTGGKYEPDVRIQRTLVPVFEETGVDVVFCGHDHCYQRMTPLRQGEIVAPDEGVLYIITGAGGASLYEPKGPRPDYMVVHEYERHSFTQVMIDGPTLDLRQITADGSLIDEYTMTKPATESPDGG